MVFKNGFAIGTTECLKRTVNEYKWMKDNGVEPEDLDEIVHEAANDMAEIMASNVNNEGLNSQVDFLNTSASLRLANGTI